MLKFSLDVEFIMSPAGIDSLWLHHGVLTMFLFKVSGHFVLKGDPPPQESLSPNDPLLMHEGHLYRGLVSDQCRKQNPFSLR